MPNPLLKIVQDIIFYGMERFGKYYSSYRGFVYDRDDPDGLGRIQLIVPHVYGATPYKYWAWPVGQYSGKNYGIHCIPQKGDMVFVEFEAGDPKMPMWKHGHFGRDPEGNSEIPSTLRDPDIYWFKTPGGLGIIFNDKTGEIQFLGSSVDQKSLGHTIRVGNNTIEVTDSGVNITSKDGKVYINGGNPVLYSKNPMSSEILELSEIGVSKTVKVG